MRRIQPFLLVVLLCPATASAAELDWFDDFFADPWRAFREGGVQPEHRVIALSHLAELCASRAASGDGLTRERARGCLERTLELSLDERLTPWGVSEPPAELGPHPQYLSHLGIVLAAWRKVTAPPEEHPAVDLHRRLAEHLAATLTAPGAPARAFPRTSARWPADEAATLYAIYLADRIEGREGEQALATPAVRRWLRWMNEHGTDRASGLYRSELSGRFGSDTAMPRGGQLASTIRYMSAFAPVRARRLWQQFRDTFAERVGFWHGFREWPKGVDRPADGDSGPIYEGVGSAATAFAIPASRSVGDRETNTKLLRTWKAVRSHVDAEDVPTWLRGCLTRALTALGVEGRPWW